MTMDEWKPLARLLADGFAGDFDPGKAKSYFRFLESFPVELVEGAVMRAAHSGQPYVPKVPELIADIKANALPPLPGRSEAWEAVQHAMNFKSQEEAVTWLAGSVHPALAAFYAKEGHVKLRREPFFNEDFGFKVQADLLDRFEEYAGTAQERLSRGLALDMAERRMIGPRQMDAAALLGLAGPDEGRPQLGAGS